MLDVDAEWPHEVAVVLAAAEASGLADACAAEAAAYARVREQFGRPIGQFQAVKHRTARMLARAEQARACAWDAARAVDELVARHTPRPEAALAVAVAGSLALDAAFAGAKDLVNTLGGIGFTWEHPAGFRLRRAHTLLLVHGPTQRWQGRVAEHTLAGVRRHLAVELPPQADAVREEVREELAAATGMTEREQAAYLAGHGYTAPHYPRPWGRGADAVTQLVIAEELVAADLHPPRMVIGNWAVPTLVEHGSRELQERLVPASLRGDLV